MSGELLFTERASAPSTPDPGDLSFYAKTDDKLYYKTDAGVEVEIPAKSELQAFAVAMAIAVG